MKLFILPLLAIMTSLAFSSCDREANAKNDPSPSPSIEGDPGAKGGLATGETTPPAPEPDPMPKREPYKPLTDEELRAKLTPLQYQVTKHEATERPWTNKYDKHFEEGIYVCIISGEPLFSSTDKYDSGCGWPAFSKPINAEEIGEKTDYKIGYARTEVRAKTGDSHLGHVFDDGPAELGGMRYCINSASLRFVPKDKMLEEGYGELLPLLEKKDAKE